MSVERADRGFAALVRASIVVVFLAAFVLLRAPWLESRQPVKRTENEPRPVVLEIELAPEVFSRDPESSASETHDEPSKIYELLLRARHQDDLGDRLDAIAALADSPSLLAALTLRSLLDDPRIAVRREAVESLGAMESVDAVEGLGYALSDADQMVRRIAIESLADIGSDDALNTLALTLSDPDAELRELVVYELADADSGTGDVLLQLFLADEDPQVSSLAAESLDQRLGGEMR